MSPPVDCSDNTMPQGNRCWNTRIDRARPAPRARGDARVAGCIDSSASCWWHLLTFQCVTAAPVYAIVASGVGVLVGEKPTALVGDTRTTWNVRVASISGNDPCRAPMVRVFVASVQVIGMRVNP